MAGRRWEFEYHPVGMEQLAHPAGSPAPGTRVVLDPERPRDKGKPAVVMVRHAETGEPIAPLPRATLMRVSRARGGNPQPVATDRVLGLVQDRRLESTP